MPEAPASPIPVICSGADGRAARRLLSPRRGAGRTVERVPARIRSLEFRRQGLQALEREIAFILVALKGRRVADQRVELSLFRFQALDFLGQLRELTLFVVGQALELGRRAGRARRAARARSGRGLRRRRRGSGGSDFWLAQPIVVAADVLIDPPLAL